MKRMMVLLAVGASLLGVGGGVASADIGSPSPSQALNQSLTQGLQQALINQTSTLLASATNSVSAGGNICFGGCPSIAIGTNLVAATQLNVGIVTQAMNQVVVSLDNVGSPTINIIGIQLVGN